MFCETRNKNENDKKWKKKLRQNLICLRFCSSRTFLIYGPLNGREIQLKMTILLFYESLWSSEWAVDTDENSRNPHTIED